MYSHDNHTLIGYPNTEDLPLLDHQFWASSQPNIPPPMCLMSINSGLNIMGYNSFCGNEGNIYASPKDFSPGLLQRSMSSHSLQNSTKISSNGWFKRLGLVSGLENYPVRKIFGTGDLQMIKEAQHSSRAEGSLPSESSSIIKSMNKACPYSPEEKKERIERYRSKRIQRNFTKKIKYECRKTLAENRPRVKGRFARNDEIEKNSQSRQSRHECAVEDYEDDNNWLNLLDSFSANMIP